MALSGSSLSVRRESQRAPSQPKMTHFLTVLPGGSGWLKCALTMLATAVCGRALSSVLSNMPLLPIFAAYMVELNVKSRANRGISALMTFTSLVNPAPANITTASVLVMIRFFYVLSYHKRTAISTKRVWQIPLLLI
ncbi:MAG: hypothetical protein BWY37_01556 [Firmicutes bacterium ADurb.Bin262]|nr:MAG: hypothetical protein BWY37_01556 [Firmicutes bacterium ADurb.Bin262]